MTRRELPMLWSNPGRDSIAKTFATLRRQQHELRTRIPYSGPFGPSRWCFYCGRRMVNGPAHRRHLPRQRTIDHVVPRSQLGGSRGGKDNEIDCCRECNSDKGSENMLVFLLRRPLMWRSTADLTMRQKLGLSERFDERS